MIDVVNNKSYEIVESYLLFDFINDNYSIGNDVLKRLLKDLGLSLKLYETIHTMDKETSQVLINFLIDQSGHNNVMLLINTDTKEVVGYTLGDRTPILNNEFIKVVDTISTTNDHIYLSEVHYHKDDLVSTCILKKKDPIIIEEVINGVVNLVEYNIGILLCNEEDNTTYTRLVLYIGDQPVYLPASFYNATTSRYHRSTSSSVEALEVLMLKVLDDLREDYFKSKIQNLHYLMRSLKDLPISYEEYSTILNYLRKIPTVIDNVSVIDSLTSMFDLYESKFPSIKDKKSSYLWRCTALSDIKFGEFIDDVSALLSTINAVPSEYFDIRVLLGQYISTIRNAGDIATNI